MRKLECVTLSSFVLALVVLWLKTSHASAAVPVAANQKMPATSGSEATACDRAEDALGEPGTTDQSIGGDTGEDRVLSFGIRLSHSGGDTVVLLEHAHGPTTLAGESGTGDGNRAVAQDVLISYKPAA
ncbi:MAG TPA: hypothetical protein VH482_25970 [Thermomicrobiales bacterium]|jgi:hypothetical protein